MKIAYITQFVPYPLDNGAVIKTFSTLKKLANENNEVVVFAFAKSKHLADQHKAKESLKHDGIHVKKIISLQSFQTTSLKSNIVIFIRSVLSLDPFNAYRFRSSNMKTSIEAYFKKNNVDTCWIDTTNMAQFIPRNFKGNKVLETHNVQSALYKEMFFNDSNYLFRLFAFHEWIKYILFQHRYFRRFDSIIAISETDKVKLKAFTKSINLSVLYPTVPVPKIQRSKAIPNSMLFIGSLYWYPNRDGIQWFIKNVYPIVADQIPDIKLTIVGETAPEFKFPQYPGIEFVGYQKDVSQFYNRSSLFIVPIRYGGGVRIKILEALSYKIQIIATHKAVEGLSPEDKGKVICVSSKQEMAEEIITKLGNEK